MNKLFATILAFLISTAGVAVADSLHVFCASPTPTCFDNGTITLTSSTSPYFGFTAASGPETGDFLIIGLIPNNEPKPLSFNVIGGTTSPAVALSVGTWTSTSVKLDSFLGLNGGAQPQNPIGAFLPSTQVYDPSATGYFVYMADLGTNTLAAQGSANPTPILHTNYVFPEGTVIVGFLNTGTSGNPNWVATANSAGGLLIDRAIPEPFSLIMFGMGLVVLAGWLKRKGSTRVH